VAVSSANLAMMTTLPDQLEPSTSALLPEKRIDAIDAVRGVALFGVLIVNVVTEFRVSIFQQFLGDEPGMTASDLLVSRLVSLFLEMKAFSLFSILFGLGLAMQFERLGCKGQPYYFLARRLIVLAFLGVCHLLFIWNGDILTEYALAGLIVLPLIALPTGALGAISMFFLMLFVALPMAAATRGMAGSDIFERARLCRESDLRTWQLSRLLALQHSRTAALAVSSRLRFSQDTCSFLLWGSPLENWTLPATIRVTFSPTSHHLQGECGAS
jgi:uncharacterized membrane protein YeiB